MRTVTEWVTFDEIAEKRIHRIEYNFKSGYRQKWRWCNQHTHTLLLLTTAQQIYKTKTKQGKKWNEMKNHGNRVQVAWIVSAFFFVWFWFSLIRNELKFIISSKPIFFSVSFQFRLVYIQFDVPAVRFHAMLKLFFFTFFFIIPLLLLPVRLHHSERYAIVWVCGVSI